MGPTIFMAIAIMCALGAFSAWISNLLPGPMVVLPPLPNEKLSELPQVKRWLSTGQNVNLRDYSTFEFGRQRDESAISIIVPEKTDQASLDHVRQAIAPPLLAFIGTFCWLGDEHPDGVELVVAACENQFDIIRIAQSNGANYDIYNDDLILKMQEYDSRYGIDITRAAADLVAFRIKRMPDDINAFAAELYEFCPDIVEQGCGTVEALAEEIERDKTVYLWWD